jgi:hypothetical protein
MLAEIKRVYRTLGDAVVEKFEYATSPEDGYTKALHVHLSCLNWETEEWQKITLMCINVTHFQFLENRKTPSHVVFEALLQQDPSGIVVDFYPIQVDGLGRLAEDPQSSFLLHCQAIRYLIQA